MFGRRVKTPAAGTQAPKFRLTGVNGTQQSLDEILARGPALLAFFKVSCPVCQFTAPYLDRLSANPSVQVIGVSQDDASSTQAFQKRFGMSVATLLDTPDDGYPASNAYGISSVPTLFLIETDGTISKTFAGFSKRDFEEIGERIGVVPFSADDHVPAWKAG
jgi:peroxiredoxin